MFGEVLCLVFIILRAEANVFDTANPEIRLSNFNKNENYTVWKDKPLKIIMENLYARYVWCYDTYSKNGNVENFVPTTEFSNDSINILNITNVTAEMSTRWVCTVLSELHSPVPYTYKNHKYTATVLYFHLHVKGARAVILIANNQSLTYVTTNLSVNYDGEVNYTYEDGDDFLLDFSCTKAKDNHKQDTLRLEYYNAKGLLLFETNTREKQPQFFRSALKSKNDKYYLECIRTASEPKREYRYRTTFLKNRAHAVQHAVILSVNGQKLTTSFNNDTSYDYYIFRYIYGEILNVTCRKMDFKLRGPLTFNSDAKITSQTVRGPSEAVISIKTSLVDIRNKSLTCISNDHVQKPYARLLFLSDVSDNGETSTISTPVETSTISTPVETSTISTPVETSTISTPVETSTNRTQHILVYCLTAAGFSIIIILAILYWTVKKSCCCIGSRPQELPPPVPAPRPHPDTVFYENLLSVFQPINEREAAELEHVYEEIQLSSDGRRTP